MANKAKVPTEEVETLNEEVPTEEVETIVDTDELETEEQKEHREEIQSLGSGYTVLANLKHNGTRYNVGDKISLSEDEALALIGTVE